MESDIDRNIGEQPITRIMAEYVLKTSNIVAASTEQITYKMISKSCKGRKLTKTVQKKVLNALNKATGKSYLLKDIFTY